MSFEFFVNISVIQQALGKCLMFFAYVNNKIMSYEPSTGFRLRNKNVTALFKDGGGEVLRRNFLRNSTDISINVWQNVVSKNFCLVPNKFFSLGRRPKLLLY